MGTFPAGSRHNTRPFIPKSEVPNCIRNGGGTRHFLYLNVSILPESIDTFTPPQYAVLGSYPGYFSGQALVQSGPPRSIAICATVHHKGGGSIGKREIAGKHITLFRFIIT
jgi:hypothetical protein